MSKSRTALMQSKVRPIVKAHFLKKYPKQSSEIISDYLEKLYKRDKRKGGDNK